MARACLGIFALALALGALAGCGNNVGDSCSVNVDCSPLGDRFCDSSAPGGYCTIDGCDENTCPGEAVCIRFFTPVLSEPCTFDAAQPNSRSNCQVDERCLCDQSVNGTCTGTAHCAPEASERRWCQLKCTKNSDCRAGYECRTTGSLGAEPVPTQSNLSGTPAKFCAPIG